MNKVILIGRLTNDPKVACSQNGIQVANFTLAVNRTYKNKDGKYDADFIKCIAFRNTAEFIGKYFKKGNQVCIEGSIQTRTYEKEKEKIYITEIITDSVMLLEKKEKTEVPEHTTSAYDNNNTDITLEDADLPW